MEMDWLDEMLAFKKSLTNMTENSKAEGKQNQCPIVKCCHEPKL